MSVSVGIVVVCDTDGCHSMLDTGLPGTSDTEDAVRRALAAGWITDRRQHYCPRCAGGRRAGWSNHPAAVTTFRWRDGIR